MRALCLAIIVLATGCFFDTTGNTNEPVTALGSLRVNGYHISAGSVSALPSGDFGLVVTANGARGYTVAWSDRTNNVNIQFAGTISSDGNFSNVTASSANAGVTNTASNRIDFNSIPNGEVDSATFNTSADPIYITLSAPSTGAIYFTGASTSRLLTSAYNPVAFVSP